jgi:HEAT repeat protein
MTTVAISALVLWAAPICHQYWWTWTVVRDVKRGTHRASPEGFWAAGPASVRALRETVRNGQKNARIAALESLCEIAQAPVATHRDLAKPAIPELIEALRDKDDDVRTWAAIALGQIGSEAVSAVEPLLSLLQEKQNPQVIPCAVRALGEIGSGARSALPELVKMVQSGHPSQIFAAQAIWRIGPKGPAEISLIIPKLVDQLAKSKDGGMRSWIAEVLCEVGPAAKDAIPVLSTASRDSDAQVRRAAGDALRAITGVAAELQSVDPLTTRNP